jgi:CheY-like chemotaxis protein
LIDFNNSDFNGMEILIVDDTPTIIDVLCHILKKSSLKISTATDGEKALEYIDQSKPDLILMDVLMPRMNGYEACMEIKRIEDDIPVIFLSGLAETEDMVKGFQAGGVDYITKPFQKEEVICRISTQLKLKKSQKELAKREKLYRTIVEKVPELIFQVDSERNISFANSAFIKLGYEPDNLIGKPIEDLIASTNKDEVLEGIATKYVGPLATSELEVELKVNEASALFGEMETLRVLIDSTGIWNVPDEEVFKNKTKKEFLGTLCVGRAAIL